MAKIKGIFINEDGCIRYAEAIVSGIKKVETRSRNMLKNLVGERVAIVRTRRGKSPVVVGYAYITAAWKYDAEQMNNIRSFTLIPVGSKFDTGARWCYWMSSAEKCDPYPLPKNAVRHGRSWCEWEEV